MTARMLLLIAAALLSAANPPARSEETPAAPNVAKCQEAVTSINAEIENSLAIFRDAVTAGKEEDGWSAEVKEAALRWLENDRRIAMSTILRMKDPDARKAALADYAKRRHGAMDEPKPPWPASELADWLISRIIALERQRLAGLASYAGELTAFAEDSWLKAQKPGDLRPVTKAFAALDAIAPRYLATTNLTPAMRMPRGPNGEALWGEDPRRVDAFYASLLTAGNDPLVLPDPAKDVERFTQARVTWSLLLLRSNLPFQSQPRVAARVRELDDEYAALRASAAEKLNAMILENAPSAKFEPALKYFNGFQAHFDPRQLGIPPSPPAPVGVPMVMGDGQGRTFMGQMPGLIHDYHDLLGARPGPMPTNPMWAVQDNMIRHRLTSVPTFGVNKAYGEWLDFRRAQEKGAAAGELESLWQALSKSLWDFPRDVKISIEKRRGAARAEEIAATTAPRPMHQKAQPVAELISALEAAAARAQIHRPANEQNDGVFRANIKQLLDAWTTIGTRNPEDAPAPHAEDAASLSWRALAERADYLALFALREKAVRSELAQLPARRGGSEGETVPVRQALEDALELCALDSDWASFHRVLRLDSAANLLANSERRLWIQIAEAFEQAARERGSSPDSARVRYVRILELSDDAEITTLAIRQLKALPAKQTRP